MRWLRSLALGIATITLTGCGGGPAQAAPPPSAAWTEFRHLHGVVDLAGPRSDGSFLVAAFGRLFVLRGGALTPFARGAGGYQTSIRCANTCTVRLVAAGPAVAHAEGHIVFASS